MRHKVNPVAQTVAQPLVEDQKGPSALVEGTVYSRDTYGASVSGTHALIAGGDGDTTLRMELLHWRRRCPDTDVGSGRRCTDVSRARLKILSQQWTGQMPRKDNHRANGH